MFEKNKKRLLKHPGGHGRCCCPFLCDSNSWHLLCIARGQTINLCLWFEHWAQLTGLLLISRLELFSVPYLAWAVPLGHSGTMGHGAWVVNGRVDSSEQSFLIATLSSIESEEFNFQRLLNNLGFRIHAPSTIHQSVMIIYLYSPSSGLQPPLYTAKQKSGTDGAVLGSASLFISHFQPFEQTTLWNSEITSYCFI